MITDIKGIKEIGSQLSQIYEDNRHTMPPVDKYVLDMIISLLTYDATYLSYLDDKYITTVISRYTEQARLSSAYKLVVKSTSRAAEHNEDRKAIIVSPENLDSLSRSSGPIPSFEFGFYWFENWVIDAYNIWIEHPNGYGGLSLTAFLHKMKSAQEQEDEPEQANVEKKSKKKKLPLTKAQKRLTRGDGKNYTDDGFKLRTRHIVRSKRK